MIERSIFLILIGLSVTSIQQLAAGDVELPLEQVKFFENEIRPLLAANCYKCHGAKKQNGKLRLDSRGAVLAGGESGPAVVPGKPMESLLVEAINYETLEMPPSGKLKPEQVAILTRWIKMGAPWPNSPEHVAVAKPKITDDDRAYWAFQPVKDVSPPAIENDWCQNEIDRFILRRLEAEKLEPSPQAEPLALVRRIFFDLVGVPPTPVELKAFEADSIRNPKSAISNLVDRLLDDPRYGERWARHWLDLVRYAESDGYKQDAYRPHAWRYRDYVIRSLNNDKPYDQFVMEQLAGDEIAPHDPDAIVATAYLRHWIYEYNQRDVRTQWDGILNDITDVTSDVFLGMGMGCARCHDHKFDPILQKDYYRLKAFFAPLLPRDDLPLGTADEIAEYHRKQTEWVAKTADLRQQIDEIERPHRRRVADPQINKFPPDIRPMVRKLDTNQTPFERQMTAMVNRQVQEQYAKLDVASKLEGDELAKYQELKKQLATFDHLKPKPLAPAFTVSDVGANPPKTFIPGDRKKHDILPGYLTVLDASDAMIERPAMTSQSTGRRTTLARWIASADNPLTTRVIVNRIWQHHFGRGIVSTSSDFGRLGERPTHPELLDWLTRRFIDQGWSFKKLHRLILNSATYQQSAISIQRTTPEFRDPKLIDPSNRLLWKMNVQRLAAEQIRDAMLAVSGELDAKAGGPSADTSSPRRTIYTKILRNRRDPLLDVFDAPDNFNSMSERNTTTTPTQSLLMINGEWTLARARAFASRLQRENKEDARRIDEAFRLAFGRDPSEPQRRAALAFLDQQAGEFEVNKPKPNVPATAMLLNRTAADLSPSGMQKRLHVPNSDSLPSGDFTIEAVVLLRSLYKDATVRTIVAHWDSNSKHPGWSLGVTSEKSGYQPRNFILQFVGKQGYEVVPSNLRPELNKPYYLAASVKIAETGKDGITFYMKDLSKPDAEMQTAQVAHKVTADFKPSHDLTIGGRAISNSHQWDGLIDEVRLSQGSLATEQLLISNRELHDSVVGWWTFEKEFFADGSARANNLRSQIGPPPISPRSAAWIDFCHVLLNSNEFIYVD